MKDVLEGIGILILMIVLGFLTMIGICLIIALGVVVSIPYLLFLIFIKYGWLIIPIVGIYSLARLLINMYGG